MRQALFGHQDVCSQISAPSRVVAIFADRVLRTSFLGRTLVLEGAATQAQTLASLPSSQPIDKNGSARPVAAWTQFCERQPQECRIDTSEPTQIELTPQVWRAIVAV